MSSVGGEEMDSFEHQLKIANPDNANLAQRPEMTGEKMALWLFPLHGPNTNIIQCPTSKGYFSRFLTSTEKMVGACAVGGREAFG